MLALNPPNFAQVSFEKAQRLEVGFMALCLSAGVLCVPVKAALLNLELPLHVLDRTSRLDQFHGLRLEFITGFLSGVRLLDFRLRRGPRNYRGSSSCSSITGRRVETKSTVRCHARFRASRSSSFSAKAIVAPGPASLGTSELPYCVTTRT